MIHYSMLYDPIQVKLKVMEVWNVQKWPISKSVFSINMHVIKKLMVNSDKTMSKF